jgi:hypothetical protein
MKRMNEEFILGGYTPIEAYTWRISRYLIAPLDILAGE